MKRSPLSAPLGAPFYITSACTSALHTFFLFSPEKTLATPMLLSSLLQPRLTTIIGVRRWVASPLLSPTTGKQRSPFISTLRTFPCALRVFIGVDIAVLLIEPLNAGVCYSALPVSRPRVVGGEVFTVPHFTFSALKAWYNTRATTQLRWCARVRWEGGGLHVG